MNNFQPGLVSVMMPAYNAGRFIAEAIESVQAQSYPDWELLVVNDGSTDETAVIAQRYTHDPRVRLLHKENGGEASARNVALENSRGEFIAYLDSDDGWLPHHLEVTIQHLAAHPEHDAVYTDGYHYDPQGRRGSPLSSNRRGPYNGRLYEALVWSSNIFGPPICVVLRHDLVARHRLRYDTRIVIGPDWDFFIRYTDLAQFGYVDERTCLYRVHETNITVQVGGKRRAGYLALCREKAIAMPSFAHCPAETRAYVFYDLLIVLLAGEPERQTAVTLTPQFAALPPHEQGRLLRLLASKTLLRDQNIAPVADWLARAQAANPQDRQTRLLAAIYRLNPGLARWFLRQREGAQPKAPANQSPFGDLV